MNVVVGFLQIKNSSSSISHIYTDNKNTIKFIPFFNRHYKNNHVCI